MRGTDAPIKVSPVSREVVWSLDPNINTVMLTREILRSLQVAFNIAIQADIAEVWYNPGMFMDFSDESNRAKFHSAELTPVNLGNDGSFPTGSAPFVYLHQGENDLNAENFAINHAQPDDLTRKAIIISAGGYGVAPTTPSI